MVANNGNAEGLFRGAFMQSGSPIPVGDITLGQKYYDGIVSETKCSGAVDTLACLRLVPYDVLKAAIKSVSPGIFSYQVISALHYCVCELISIPSQSLVLAWLPRADGVFVTENPQKLVLDGKVANVPFVTGISTFPISSQLTNRLARRSLR
jgi:acetylcholinesterase